MDGGFRADLACGQLKLDNVLNPNKDLLRSGDSEGKRFGFSGVLKGRIVAYSRGEIRVRVPGGTFVCRSQ